MTIHVGYSTHCVHNFNASARVKSMKSECSRQPDIPTRSRLSQHANLDRWGGHTDGLFFGDLSKNKMRPTRKNCVSTLRALVGLREPNITQVVLIRRSGRHEECLIRNCIGASSRLYSSTMQRLGSLGLGTFQMLSDRLRNDSVFNTD